MASSSGTRARATARRRALTAAVVAGLLSSSSVQEARGQEESVDRVLAALAEVVRDRAKRVASRTIERHLKNRLCGEKHKRTFKVTADDHSLVLWLGGTDDCRNPDKKKCTPDDVFVESCSLLTNDALALTDPYFLKALSRDAVALLFRIGGASLDADVYDKYALDDVALFAHAVMERIVLGQDVAEFADPTLDLANAIETGLLGEIVDALGSAPPIATSYASVRTWLTTTCAADTLGANEDEKRTVCDEVNAAPDSWVPDLPGAAGACDRWSQTDERQKRTTVFTEVFGENGPYRAAKEGKPCNQLPADPSNPKLVSRCETARVAVNLADHLAKLTCHAKITDSARRPLIRQLATVVRQREVYRAALRAGTAAAAFEAYLTAASEALHLKELPRQALATAVRLVGAYLAAHGDDPEATATWIRTLRNDLALFNGRSVRAAVDDFMSGDALGTDSRAHLTPALQELRDAVKDLITLPLLYLARYWQKDDEVQAALSAAVDVFRRLTKLQVPGRTLAQRIGDLADTFESIAALVKVLEPLVDEETKATLEKLQTQLATAKNLADAAAKKRTVNELEVALEQVKVEGSADTLAALVSALTTASGVLRLAARKDWVSLALALSAKLQLSSKDTWLRRSIRFVRVLMSAYQAESTAEAKGIFEAALEDETSRDERFDHLTFDVTALFAARFGWQAETWKDIDADEEHRIYGLYAPFGVQVAYDRVGFLAYPLDLGAYVTADKENPDWHEALRFGGAFYGRGRDIPIAVGIGADVKPAFSDESSEKRFYVFAALELPLYLIH